jgi:hypothetical protein
MNKLNTTILAGALAATLLPSAADAQQSRELGAARAFEVILASTTTDLAPTRLYDDGIRRLRKTDEEFTNEQASIKFSPDGKYAAVVAMWTGPLNEGTAREQLPVDRMQCALTIMETYQEADGSVALKRATTSPYSMFITDNEGNEYRNCNKPQVLLVNKGQQFAVEFNYQPNGTNDTRRYMKIFNWPTATSEAAVVPVLKNAQGQTQKQIQVFAKNNDDAAMHQSGSGQTGVPYYDEGGRTDYAMYYGANGNGRDDGWLGAIDIQCNGGAVATDCTIKRLFDLSLCQREERSRGRCSIGPDKSFAVCTWTEGNSQPMREGTWIGAIDLSPGGQNGPDAQSRLLWKDRVNYRQTLQANGEDREYYAMRVQHGRILAKQADGTLAPTDEIIWEDGFNRGGNNNDKKGGRTDAMNFAVMKVTREGYTYTMPMTTINMGTSPMLLGLDATHISMEEAVFGKGDTLIPGFTQLQGSQTGGLQQDGDIRTIGYDPATKTILNLGQHNAAASYDRHLYSNYLGNNPGNQGRNFAGSDLIKNPFFGVNGNQIQYYQAFAVTGKAPMHESSAIKPSLYISMFPVAFSADAPDPQGGYNDNVPGDDMPDDPAPEEPPPLDTSGDDGFASGGCSTGAGNGGAMLGLGLALALTLRRRGRKAE